MRDVVSGDKLYRTVVGIAFLEADLIVGRGSSIPLGNYGLQALGFVGGERRSSTLLAAQSLKLS
jgi:hypothetical protein